MPPKGSTTKKKAIEEWIFQGVYKGPTAISEAEERTLPIKEHIDRKELKRVTTTTPTEAMVGVASLGLVCDVAACSKLSEVVCGCGTAYYCTTAHLHLGWCEHQARCTTVVCGLCKFWRAPCRIGYCNVCVGNMLKTTST